MFTCVQQTQAVQCQEQPKKGISASKGMTSPSVWYGVNRHKQDTTLSKLYCMCKLQFKDLKLDIGCYRNCRKKLPRLPVIIISDYASLKR